MTLVGAVEAAEILGVSGSIISRWRKDGRMPPTVAHPAATPLWRKADIEKYDKDGRVWKGRPPVRRELWGLEEAHLESGVSKRQITRWHESGKFPRAVVRVKAGPFWEADAVRAWIADRA